jgi:hypothetical protein
MNAFLGGVVAACCLVATGVVVVGVVASLGHQASTEKINDGAAEVAKVAPPPGDPGSSVASPPSSSSPTNAGDSGTLVQNAALGMAAPDAPPGASPQTTPSTLSPQNASDDRLSLEQLELPLTDAQKQILRASLAQDKESASPADDAATLAQAQVGTVLPGTLPLRDLPEAATAQVPTAKGFKYLRAANRLLLVQPDDFMVAAVLE